MLHRLLPRLIFVLGLASCATPPDAETKPMGENVLSKEELRAARRGLVDFAAHVKPVLEAKCVMCHHREALPGHSSFASRGEALRTGTLGTFIIPGNPEQSLLVANTASTHRHVSAMPAVGERLTKEEYEILRKWVREGANWPADAAGVLEITW